MSGAVRVDRVAGLAVAVVAEFSWRTQDFT
jgi:hypothetical protein